MQEELFHVPVSVIAGLGRRLEIRSLTEAERFLASLEEFEGGTTYRTAQRACRAAAAGHVTMEQTRRALVAFAEMAGIIWPEATTQSSGRLVRRSMHYVA